VKFRFDANQPHQKQAIASVADLFLGMERKRITSTREMFRYETEHLIVEPSRLLENIRTVQAANHLQQDEVLKVITETTNVGGELRAVTFPNVTLEMETGTGKTYVYLRTALELNRRYKLSKFIIVVPSVAIREGVLKTFAITRDHFADLFDNEPFRVDVYDSKNLTRLRGFAEDDAVRFLIMTIDSFNKEQNVIRQSTDRLQGRIGLHMLQAVQPVLILDEPQNMESAGRRQALTSLNPLVALRYSATHRERYNLVYRLTPFEAYRQGLVKKIEVASVVEADSHNTAFVRVDRIIAAKRSVTAKIAVHQRMASGEIKEKAYAFKTGDRLEDRAARSDYEPFEIEEIDAAEHTVRFTNGLTLREGEPHGLAQDAVFRAQIRYTVEQHFRRQQHLDDAANRGVAPRIKVLSLFFIDRVDNYTAPNGLIRRLFDEAFDDLKQKYPPWASQTPGEVRGAYFAGKRRKGGAVDYQDSTTGDNAEDRAAYTLIMRDKERLLSFAEPVAFVFSHSALREGWDNPNVFQICTLNQTTSTLKKRQEIGRGLRLAVDITGARQRDDRVNVLTVVANESYEDYVRALQREIAEEVGADEAKKMKPSNARLKQTAIRKPLSAFPPEFAALWERIKHRTRYRVVVDTRMLVAHVVHELNLRVVDPPRIEVTRARVEAQSGDVFTAMQLSGAKTVATLTGRFPLPNVVERIAELLSHTASTPVRLTRRTLLSIITGVTKQQAILDNPNEFATIASDVIREKLENQLVFGIRYEKDGTWYEQGLFAEEIETQSDRLLSSTKSLYDRFVFESEVERRFAEKLETRADVLFYVKLPPWFRVQTPIGNYNPDWALVMEDTDEFGEKGERMYLVRETKGTKTLSELYRSEVLKLRCGARHFNSALEVDFKLVESAEELPGGTEVQ